MRSKARQQALQILYQSEITGETADEIIDGGTYSADLGTLDDYAVSLVRGVLQNREAVDTEIAAISENWSLSRMPIVDRNILRIATYELYYDDSIPPSVAINEAVELAKLFGREDSSKFVNGVLGRAAVTCETGGRKVAADTTEEPTAEDRMAGQDSDPEDSWSDQEATSEAPEGPVVKGMTYAEQHGE